MKRAIFVSELVPSFGRSGQEKYNADIADAALALGYSLDLIITSPRRDLLPDPVELDVRGFGDVHYLHFWRVGDALVPRSIPALARSLKHALPKRGGGSGNDDKVGHIGRPQTAREARLISRIVARRTHDLLLVDTIFRAHRDWLAGARARKILILHDVFHERCASFRANGFDVRPDISSDQEVRAWTEFDGLVAINDEERGIVQGLLPDAPVQAIYPVATNEPAGHGSDASSPSNLLFVGAAGPHNIDGLHWFLSNCWDQIRKAVPDARLHIAGTAGDMIAAPDGVTSHGRVNDLTALAALCKIGINPLRMGSGLKIKMVDYFTLGLPCVTTPTGAQGFPQFPAQPFVVASDAAAFATAVVKLLTDEQANRTLRQGIGAYVANFSHRAAVERLGQLCDPAKNDFPTAQSAG